MWCGVAVSVAGFLEASSLFFFFSLGGDEMLFWGKQTALQRGFSRNKQAFAKFDAKGGNLVGWLISLFSGQKCAVKCQPLCIGEGWLCTTMS